LFAVLSLVPLVLLTYATIQLSDQTVVHEVTARVRTTSAVTAVLLQQQLQAVSDLTESYSTRPLLIAALADGNPTNFRGDVISLQLAQLRGPRPRIAGTFLTDTSCRLTQVEPATPEIIGMDFSFRDWCSGVKSTDRPYISEAYRTAISGQQLVVRWRASCMPSAVTPRAPHLASWRRSSHSTRSGPSPTNWPRSRASV